MISINYNSSKYVFKTPTIHFNALFNSLERGGHFQWPPKSPDGTALDFCLWGWMKSEVYKGKVNARDEMVAHIMNSAALVKQERQDDSKGATRTVAKRVEKCIEAPPDYE
jgi:hypothetical protein